MTLKEANPHKTILHAVDNAKITHTVKTQDFSQNVIDIAVGDGERGNVLAVFSSWLCGLVKSSFGFVPMEWLKEQEAALREKFDQITYERDGVRYFSSKYDHAMIEANIRKGFCDKRAFNTKEESIPQEAKLLNITNFTEAVNTDSPEIYYPVQAVVDKIILDDAGKLEIPQKELDLINMAEEAGHPEMAENVRQKYISHPAKDRSFHYLPYKTDSGFEETFLREVLVFCDNNGLRLIDKLELEVYYNGDRALTEFRIRCYKRIGKNWRYIGLYTPDFLIIQRRGSAIYKAIIVETKGKGFAADFAEKRIFMDTYFKEQNNKAYGYERFEFLYLEDSLPEKERIARAHTTICKFFKEETDNA